jgi:CubicO group peptidase (beta-lactamase class C family)
MCIKKQPTIFRFTYFLFYSSIIFILSGCTFGRTIFWNLAGQEDIKRFPSTKIKADTATFDFFTNSEPKPLFIDQYSSAGSNSIPLDIFLKDFKHNLAFLVIKDDSILFEQYGEEYNRESIVTTFSVSKSIVAMIIGVALEEGLITSLQDPITKYLPELDKQKFGEITIEHLLLHTSGIRFKERYLNPFNNDIARYYYGRNVNSAIDKLHVEHRPGVSFHYHSANTQLLGLIISHATGMSVSEYFQDRIWSKIGTEHDASWSTYEKQPIEKTFCCFNSTPEDLAKFGKLVMNGGVWNGQQLIPKDWIDKTHARSIENGSIWGYQYHMILGLKEYGDFMSQGLYDQYIYMMPEKNILIISVNATHKPSINWRLVFLQIVDQL